MRICPACRGEIPEEATLCMHCGQKPANYLADGTRRPRPWITLTVLGAAAVLAFALIWNQNRIDQEREDRNVCGLVAEMEGTDPSEC